jgi:lipopolysaccharide export system permease protein
VDLMALFVRMTRVLQRLRTPQGRLGSLLSNYVIRTVAVPTSMALVGFTTLILTKDLLSFSDFVINRGFGVAVVAMIAGYEIIPLLTRTLPFAVLIGTLVGLGGMQANLEIVALQAAGIAKKRLLGPVLAFATILVTIGLVLTLFCSPWASRSLDDTLRDMATRNPGLGLRQGVVHEFGTVKLLAHEVSARGDQLRGVLLWSPEQGQMLFAQRGAIAVQSEGAPQLALYDGIMLPGPQQHRETTYFKSFFHSLQENTGPIRRNENFLTGLPLDDLTRVAWSEADDAELTRRAQLEWHHRVAYPATSLCFGVLAVALTVAGQRFSRAAGGVMGLVITLLYYGLVQLGNGLVQAGLVRAWTGVWLPNAVTSLIAILLLWQDTLQPLRNRHRKPTEPGPNEANRHASGATFCRIISPVRTGKCCSSRLPCS